MTVLYPPDFFTYFHIRVNAIPDSHDILTLPDADCTPTDFWPLLAVIVLCAVTVIEAAPSAFVKHVTHDATHEILPYTIGDTLS